MQQEHFDIVIAGGGIAGSAFASVAAESGARVLLLEADSKFRDRVRGEAMMPWGAVDARALGILDTLIEQAGAVFLSEYDSIRAGEPRSRGHVLTEAAPHVGILAFSHAAAQEALIQVAGRSGSSIVRGARVENISSGQSPVVAYRTDAGKQEVTADLVVGADGRMSSARRWGGFAVQSQDGGLLTAGALVETKVMGNAALSAFNPHLGARAFLFPQNSKSARAYYVYGKNAGFRLQGAGAFPRFVSESIAAGMPASVLENARLIGPLASFDGSTTWVQRPFRDGIVLLGDAAAVSDPAWGQGLSLAMRDVRILQDSYRAKGDWKAAAASYAAEHGRYHGKVRTLGMWLERAMFQRETSSRAPATGGDPLDIRCSRLAQAYFGGPDVADEQLLEACAISTGIPAIAPTQTSVTVAAGKPD